MFTGIVTDLGKVLALEPGDKTLKLTVECSYDISGLALGASIAHNGVCLTVVSTDPAVRSYAVEAWNETLLVTTLGTLKVGDRVNLERALKVGDELGGHIVSGHVDGIADIVSTTSEGDAVRFVIRAPAHLAPFIAPKGSVTLDGTSLTVNGVDGDCFDVLVIRHTQEVTTWGNRKAGDRLNLEIDTLARYVGRLLESGYRL